MHSRRDMPTVRQLRLLGLGCLAGLIALCTAVPIYARAAIQAPEKRLAPKKTRLATAHSLALLQNSVSHWTREVDCFSCHHQGLGGLTLSLTQELGFKSDPESVAEEIKQVHSTERARFDALLVNDGVGVFGRSTVLLGLGVRQQPKDSVTDAIASFLAARQSASGAWYSNEHRPPFEDSHVTASALTIRALTLYAPEGRQAEFDRRIQRGQKWLQDAQPKDTEERSMRLLGLAWCGEQPGALVEDSKALIAEQREDGGWAQLPSMESDAYATGQALTVLHQAGGMSPKHPAYQRGLRYLLATQLDNGSWFVKTRRRIQGNRPKNSGYPHGKHQFVSFMGGCWATMALALADVPPKPTRAFFGPPPPRIQEDPMLGARGFSSLHRAAAYGSFEQLQAELEGELDVEAKGPQGVTPLMLAAHDLRKVRLLVEHGAEVNAESDWGFTPLLSATLVQGASEVVEYLLELGADVNCSGANGASPTMCAANVGDLDTLKKLVDAGAEFPGNQLTYSLIYAATCDDVTTAQALLAQGAELDGSVTRFPAAIVSAAISGYDNFVKFTIEQGADLESRDLEGLTALAWASKFGTAHLPIIQSLIEAGADVNGKDQEGRTPLDWAVQHRNAKACELLRAAGAQRGKQLEPDSEEETPADEDRYKPSDLPAGDGFSDSEDKARSEG